MTWITVAGINDNGWSKQAALRAATTERVHGLLERLLSDLAHLGEPEQPDLTDYLDPTAVDAVRENPETFHIVGRLAANGDGAPACRTTTYWPEEDDASVDVDVEVRGQGMTFGADLVPLPLMRSRRRLTVTVDPVLDRIEKLAIS